jgi:hypothetical protein
LKRPAKKKSSRLREKALEALAKESDLALREQIRRLAKPPRERPHFLRKKVGLTGSCL